MYIGNLQKMKGVKDRITKYDMVDPFKIPVMVDLDTEIRHFGGGMKQPRVTYLSIGRR